MRGWKVGKLWVGVGGIVKGQVERCGENAGGNLVKCEKNSEISRG